MEGKFEFVGERAKDSDYYVGVIENEGEDGERMLLYRAPHAYSMVQNVCALEELDRAREELYKKQLNSETEAYAIVRRTKDLLTEAFGARKSKLYMRQERAFAVDEKKLAGEVVGKIMQNAVKAQSKSFASDAELQDRAREQKPIPPCVPDAEDPAGAYPLEQMIPRSELSTIEVDAFIEKAKQHTHTSDDISQWLLNVPNFLKAALQTVGDETSRKSAMRKSRILLYAAGILAAAQAPQQLAKREAKMYAWLEESTFVLPAAINKRIVRTFMSQKVTLPAREDKPTIVISQRTRRDVDKAISYIIALLLHVYDFHVPNNVAGGLCEDLRIADKKLIKYVRAMGCTVHAAGAARRGKRPRDSDTVKNAKLPPLNQGNVSIVLQVPLTFNDLSNKRRKLLD